MFKFLVGQGMRLFSFTIAFFLLNILDSPVFSEGVGESSDAQVHTLRNIFAVPYETTDQAVIQFEDCSSAEEHAERLNSAVSENLVQFKNATKGLLSSIAVRWGAKKDKLIQDGKIPPVTGAPQPKNSSDLLAYQLVMIDKGIPVGKTKDDRFFAHHANGKRYLLDETASAAVDSNIQQINEAGFKPFLISEEMANEPDISDFMIMSALYAAYLDLTLYLANDDQKLMKYLDTELEAASQACQKAE